MVGTAIRACQGEKPHPVHSALPLSTCAAVPRSLVIGRSRCGYRAHNKSAVSVAARGRTRAPAQPVASTVGVSQVGGLGGLAPLAM